MHTLIYRERWNEIPPARPVTQKHVSHPDLILSLHGPGRMGLKKCHHSQIEGDPFYIWSGKCEGRSALSLRHSKLLVDFQDAGMVRWCSKQSGGHLLKLIVKSVNGPWLVSDQSAGDSEDWRQFEFRPPSLSSRILDIDEVKVLGEAPAASMTKIDAVGITDLMAGGGGTACSRLAWIEVWGGEVVRIPWHTLDGLPSQPGRRRADQRGASTDSRSAQPDILGGALQTNDVRNQ